MKQLSTLFVLFFLFSLVSLAAPLKEVHRSTKNFNNIKSIEVKGDFCKVILKPSATDGVIVNSFIEASKDMEGFEINDQTEAGKLFLTVGVPSEHVSTKSGEIEIQVPTGTEIKIKTASGYIEASEIKECQVDAHASYGQITAQNVSGKYSLKTSTGGITVNDLQGELSATSSKGDIELSDIETNTTVVTDAGVLVLKNIKGKLNTQSNTGDQTITNLDGDLMLRTSTGEITLNNLKGSVETANDDGDVWLTDIEGTLRLISISGNLVGKNILLSGNAYFETTKGRVEMEFRNNLNELSFDLASNYGFLYIPGKSKKKKLKSGNGPILVSTSTNNGAQRFTLVNE
ncbi:DUF4097 family beta strand repeat-containing protein [Marinilabilia sp.]|uniref:DUF4097 family beta strand repeat-containing protein n=1 Tax=Marinilabilia sp. TaxID=2021252 RepID=UPI0025BD2F56|nr:DUF4097 family beta strand repeat-containing protein [Marinilabilia sp.]